MFVCARVHPIFFFIKYSVDWMQKFILHQFFYSYLFFKSRSFVTIEIYLQLFYEIAYSSRLIWSIASNRVKMERTRARLKLHETYNFYAVFFSIFVLVRIRHRTTMYTLAYIYTLRLTFAKKNANQFWNMLK